MSTMQPYELVMKPSFRNQWRLLPSARMPQMMEKLDALCNAPEPDSKNKKKLVGYKSLYRLRVGKYRVIYTFSQQHRLLTLLWVDDRGGVYGGNLGELDTGAAATALPKLDLEQFRGDQPPPSDENAGGEIIATTGATEATADAPALEATTPATEPNTTADSTASLVAEDMDEVVVPAREPEPDAPLDPPITRALLNRMRIPAPHHAALLRCRTLNDLYLADAPDQFRTQVFDALLEPDFDRVIQQPSLVVQDIEDLQRFHEGKLTTFLLKLDQEQQKFVEWSINSGGPSMLKGGPGSGKTVIALHRAKALMNALRAEGNSEPRVLFTAYNTTLVSTAREMIRELLGDDSALVTIQTADKLARDIVAATIPKAPDIVNESVVLGFVQKAMDYLTRHPVAGEPDLQLLASLNRVFLADEIEQVIVAREIPTLDAYLSENRAGRGVRLTAQQRRAIWNVSERYLLILEQAGKFSWATLRRRAVELQRAERGLAPFDGVMIDEAQDLQPTSIRLLTMLCKSPDRLFITADPNQSIYGSTFRWADVHADLKFRGRTGVLRRNYRTTRQIADAATTFLAGSEIETIADRAECPREGALPAVAATDHGLYDAAALLAYFRDRMRALRIGIGGCAVLVNSQETGQHIVNALNAAGAPAALISKAAIDLNAPRIKVIPMRSAKGLEFPIVAISGVPANFPGPLADNSTPEQVADHARLGHRTLYVAMTRAMEALLVQLPAKHAMIESGAFDRGQWEKHAGFPGAASV